jgi:hypothetical protein
MHSRRRLVPGESSQLEIRIVDGPVRVRGQVVRSELVQTSDGSIQYRIAVAFDTPVASLKARQPTKDDGMTFATAATLSLVLDPGEDRDHGIVNRW